MNGSLSRLTTDRLVRSCTGIPLEARIIINGEDTAPFPQHWIIFGSTTHGFVKR